MRENAYGPLAICSLYKEQYHCQSKKETFYMDRNFNGQSRARRVLLIGLIIFAAILLFPGIGIWTTVDAGYVGVVTEFGAVNRVVDPGIVLKLPLVEGVYSMETRTQKE